MGRSDISTNSTKKSPVGERATIGRNAVELTLACPLEQFLQQLSAEMDCTAVGSRPVYGRLRGTQLTARVRPIVADRWDLLNPYLSAELIDHGSKTLVRCRFSKRLFYYPAVIALACCGCAFFSLGLGLLISALPGFVLFVILYAIAIMLFGVVIIGMLVFQRSIARDHERSLMDFIRAVGDHASRRSHELLPLGLG